MAVTEQKVQANGQPQLVMIGRRLEALVTDDQREVGHGQLVEVRDSARARRCGPAGRLW